ncbi:MAG: metallophosphoesterase [Polyangiaceae bacterium]|nr:metallophosphoesterase [Polyangiaceae bacterium]
MRRTVILSDVHLSQAHPETDGDERWMRYRRRAFHPDPDFATLVDQLLSTYPADSFELVFNGDVLDYDAPWVKDGKSSFDEFPLTEDGCAEQTQRLLDDHPVWVNATAKMLLHGHRVMFLCGNHDIELVWPKVRTTIFNHLVYHWQRLWDEATANQKTDGLFSPSKSPEDKIRFRAWFHVTEDRIYLEHGSQYDHLNGVRHAILPYTKDRTRIHPIFGKQAFKRTGSRMGYFNPYYEETFYMGFWGYLTHFLTHYATSDRHIFRTWAGGMLRTAWEIWSHRHTEDWSDEVVELAAKETGATRSAILETHALTVASGENTMLPLLREAWLDRMGLFVFILLVVLGAFMLGGSKGALYTGGALFVLFILYEIVTPKPDLRTYDSAPPTVKRLWDIHNARAICMGHTHRPFSIWEEGHFYGNSGAWCPAFRDQACTEPVLDGRPFLMLWSDDSTLYGGLHWLRKGVITVDPEGVKTDPE